MDKLTNVSKVVFFIPFPSFDMTSSFAIYTESSKMLSDSQDRK